MADPSSNSLQNWLFSSTAKVAFLVFASASAFYFAEHNIEISKTAAFVEDIEDQESWAAGGNKLRQISFLGIATIGGLSLVLGRGGRFRLNPPVVLIAVYVLWAGASYVWSIDPGATMRRYIVMLCCVVGCIGFSRFLRVRDAVLAAVLVPSVYLVLGVLCEIALGSFRPHVGDYRFAGSVHPNIQAANLAMGSIAAFTMARIQPKLKVLYYVAFCILFLFLILTKCRSATATVPVALGIIWLIAQPSRNIFMTVMGAIWIGTTIGLVCMITEFDPISQNQDVLLMGRREETGSSLTGRLPLWEDLSVYIARSPTRGYGYRAFWNPRHIYEIAVSQEWVISEAHSSYIDATLQLGVVGAFMLLLTELTAFLYAAFCFRNTQRPEYLFLVGGIFFCIVRGFTESGLGDPIALTSFLFLSLAAHSWHTPPRTDRQKQPAPSTIPHRPLLQNKIPQA